MLRALSFSVRIDLKEVDHSVPGIFHHFRIFDDLFGDSVFFRIVQKMTPSCGKYDVYFGNVLHAGDTSKFYVNSNVREVANIVDERKTEITVDCSGDGESIKGG